MTTASRMPRTLFLLLLPLLLAATMSFAAPVSTAKNEAGEERGAIVMSASSSSVMTRAAAARQTESMTARKTTEEEEEEEDYEDDHEEEDNVQNERDYDDFDDCEVDDDESGCEKEPGMRRRKKTPQAIVPTVQEMEALTDTGAMATGDAEIDVVAFYTSDARAAAGTSSNIREHIRALMKEMNRAVADGNGAKMFRLVGTWELRRNDRSDWVSFVGNDNNITSDVVDSFANSNSLNNRRTNVYSADVMMLVHDWSSGTPPDVDPDTLVWAHSDLSRGVMLADSKIAADAAALPVDTSPNAMAGHNALVPGTTSLVRQDDFTLLSSVASYVASASITPVLDKSVAGNLASSTFRRCHGGVRGASLFRYEYQSGRRDIHQLRLICRSIGEVYTLGGRLPSGDRTVHRMEPISCPHGDVINGIGLIRYRLEQGNQDLYRIAVHCPTVGWIRSPSYPDAEYVSSEYKGHWNAKEGGAIAISDGTDGTDSTDDVGGGSAALNFLVFDRFRTGTVDTYSLQAGFGAAEDVEAETGSIIQDQQDYRCMTQIDGNNIAMRGCTGTSPKQRWYMSHEDGKIRNVYRNSTCLAYDGNTNNVRVATCDRTPSTSSSVSAWSLNWVYDKITSMLYSQIDPTKCATVIANQYNVAMRPCNSHPPTKDQQFNLDPTMFYA